MKSIYKIFICVAVVGVGFWSNYAFEKVDKSKSENLSRNIEKEIKQRKMIEERIMFIIKKNKEEQEKKKETLKIMFPNNKEQIDALFSNIVEETTAQNK